MPDIFHISEMVMVPRKDIEEMSKESFTDLYGNERPTYTAKWAQKILEKDKENEFIDRRKK